MSKATTALVLGDLQNDFLHPQGAYGRAKQSCAEIAFSQQPERDGVQEKHALAGERDDSALRQEVKQLVNIQVRRAHQASVELSSK